MKKTIIIAGIIFIAGFIFISCSKDDEKEKTPPALSFKSGIQTGTGLHYITKDTTITISSGFVFGIKASITSGENLKRLYVKGVFENSGTPREFDTTFSSSSISYDYKLFAYPSPGAEDFTFTVWDDNETATTTTITITTEPAAPDIKVYENVILGDQDNNTAGSFFASDEGMVYMQAEAKTNQERIDFLYYNDGVNFASIAAPNDTYAGVIYNNATTGLQTWTTLNPTKFKVTTLTNNNFNAITTSAQIVTASILPTQPNQMDINNLEDGDILAFETAGDIYGLIRIDEIIATGDDRTIKLTVKIQN